MKRKHSKKIIGFFCLALFLTLGFVFRTRIFAGIGNFLISEDRLKKTEALFVLGGDSYDRGNLAEKLFQQGYSKEIVCMGENIPTIFMALGISYAESEVTKINIISKPIAGENAELNAPEDSEKKTVPDSAVIVLKKGTSTKEEIESILNYCKTNNLKNIMIISSKFHTRRIRMVCRKLFRENEIAALIVGAPSSIYSEDEWWKSEEGLIMVNNEYVKLIYYLLRY